MEKISNSLDYLTQTIFESPPRNNTTQQQRNNTNSTTYNLQIPLENEVATAAKETASCLTNNDQYPDSLSRFEFFRYCEQKALINKLKQSLKDDPSLAKIRQTTFNKNHGQTPLHTAASYGNIEAVKLLLESSLVSSWSRDLYGRTPLHVASIATLPPQEDMLICCTILKEAMIKERGVDPTGQQAPVDLAGFSPLGWVNKETRGKASPALKGLLYRPGDASILPLTPTRSRVGQSPLFSPTSSNYASAIQSSRQRHMASKAKSVFKSFDEFLFSPTEGNELADRQISTMYSVKQKSIPEDAASSDDDQHQGEEEGGSEEGSEEGENDSDIDRLTANLDSAAQIVDSPYDPDLPDPTPVAATTAEKLHPNLHPPDLDAPNPPPGPIRYGFSVAQGWRDGMEDKLCVHCPLRLTIPQSVWKVSSGNTLATTTGISTWMSTDNLTEPASAKSEAPVDSVWKSTVKVDDRDPSSSTSTQPPTTQPPATAVPTTTSNTSATIDRQSTPATPPRFTGPTTGAAATEEVVVGLFVVCDGHGGAFTAKYITENAASVFTSVFNEACNRYYQSQYESTPRAYDTPSNLIPTPSFWSSILSVVCAQLEDSLRNQPRMMLPESGPSLMGKKSAKDNSGSTAVFTLITATHIITANVGDSRAVLAKASPKPTTKPTTTSITGTASPTTLYTAEALTRDHKFHRPSTSSEVETEEEDYNRAITCGAM